MPSLHSICVFATAALAAFVTASPIAEVVADRGALVALPRDGAVQNLPSILTVTKAQLLAVQAEANHAVATGNLTSADAANAYVDKLSSVISESLQSAKKLKGQSRSAVLGGTDLETAANSLKEIITLVTEVIQEIVPNLGTQDRSAVFGHISLYLDVLLSQLLFNVGITIDGLLFVVGGFLHRLLRTLGLLGLRATRNMFMN